MGYNRVKKSDVSRREIMYREKVVFITGAAGGIGRALVKAYAEKGAVVIGADIAAMLPREDNIHYYRMDLSKRESIEGVFEDVRKRWGRVDILINNGAIAHFNKSIFEIEIEEFDQVIDVNLRGAFICAKEYLRSGEGREYGRIINIASTRWAQGEAGWEAYCASKGGMISMSQTMAVSLAETNITVNCVSPGWIECGDYEELRDVDHSQHPSGRVGKPSDIVKACMFLSHADNDFVNGENLVVDGGMTKKMIYEG